MYSQIRSEIGQDYYLQNYQNEGGRFVAWYLRNIHRSNEIQARDEVTDGPNDNQIDAVHVDDENAIIYIIQGKFIGQGSVDSGPLQEVLSSWAKIKNLVQLQENCNPLLQRKLSEVGKALEDDYDIVFELILTSSLTDSAKKDLATFQEEISSSEDFEATISLIDSNELARRYNIAAEKENPSLSHTIQLKPNEYLEVNIAGTKAIVAPISLRDCLSLPGIKDGTLFQKNVRQSLGISNPVNKGIKATIYGDKHRDFFFFHNGITAICNQMNLTDSGALELRGLSVVNGCQSLNTILACSERVKLLEDTYIMFRFYEIPQRERADKISTFTNSQSAVRPRDLRSNDKRVLSLKRSFEQRYSNGYFITKRGEEAPPDKDEAYVLDLSELGKYLISWHSQRPNTAYSETKIFDKFFEQLFKREYKPEDAQALNMWMQEILAGWTKDNPHNLNESLLAMKAYAPYHQLYAVSMCFSIQSSMQEMVPNPSVSFQKAKDEQQVKELVKISANCLNSALESAANETQPSNRIFSPQNWIKTKTCLAAINAAIRQYFNILPTLSLPGVKELAERLRNTCKLDRDQFEYRWAAD